MQACNWEICPCGVGDGVGEGVKPACTVTFEGQKPYFLT